MALATLVDANYIANLAAAELGTGTVSDIITPGTLSDEIVYNQHYEMVRRALLRSHRWNFAIERATLVEDATVPIWGWAFRFPEPTDNLLILEVNGAGTGLGTAPFAIENGFILTDVAVARCIYIEDVTDVTRFDDLFVPVFAKSLAIKCCMQITGNGGLKAQLENELSALEFPAAITVDSNEDKPRIIPSLQDSDVIASRQGGVMIPGTYPAIRSDSYLELTGTVADATASPVTIAFGVTMPIAPTLAEISLEGTFTDPAGGTTVQVETITTSTLDLAFGTTLHGGYNYGLRIKRNV